MSNISKGTVGSKRVVWYQCKECDILLPSKFKIWSHLLKTHDIHSSSGDSEEERKWVEIQLFSEHELQVHLDVLEEVQMQISTQSTTTRSSNRNNTNKVKYTEQKDEEEDYLPSGEESNSDHGETVMDRSSIRISTGDTTSCTEWCHECEKCHKKFRLEIHLRRHRHNFHRVQKPDFFCDIDNCDRSFKVETLLEYHKLTHDPNWDKMTRDQQKKLKMKRRMAVMDARSFECEYCSLKFEYETKFRKHVRTHTLEKPYKCPNCNAKYAMANTLQTHLQENGCSKRISVDLNRPFQCELCNALLKSEKNLSNHKRLQHGIFKPREPKTVNKCLFCDYVATNMFSLKQHNMTHTGEKPYKCDACGQGFVANHNRRQHMRMHCAAARAQGLDKVVDNEAKQRMMLNNRIKTEVKEGQPLLKCPDCPLTFSTLARLTGHRKVHGEGFRCDFCNAGFIHFRGLCDHRSRLHNQETGTFVCTLCSKHFSSMTSMKRHYKTYHFVEPTKEVMSQTLRKEGPTSKNKIRIGLTQQVKKEQDPLDGVQECNLDLDFEAHQPLFEEMEEVETIDVKVEEVHVSPDEEEMKQVIMEFDNSSSTLLGMDV